MRSLTKRHVGIYRLKQIYVRYCSYQKDKGEFEWISAKNLQTFKKDDEHDAGEISRENECQPANHFKWELGAILPEVEKLVELCETFHCSIDQLLKGNMDYSNKAYSDIRIVTVEPFRYISYVVISCEPEDDAISHVEGWAKHLKIENPYVRT